MNCPIQQDLSIVVYHYVRDENPDFPGIHARTLAEFQKQIDWLKERYVFVTAQEVLAAAASKKALPEAALLCTFDDGYLEHYEVVAPCLEAAGARGCFFVPVKSHMERRVLPVNKIHFILASGADSGSLVNAVDVCLARCAPQGLESREVLWNKINAQPHWDTPEVLYIKRMLQRELPEQERDELIDSLFAEHVTPDETAFADKLYMNEQHMREMIQRGHYIGGHGYSHRWFTQFSLQELEEELQKTVDFLAHLGTDTDLWMLGYPFGGYDAEQFALLEKYGCGVAVTVQHGVANLAKHHLLELPRIDTNEFPFA